MENGIYLGLSRQIALQRNMDIIANNVANMSTPGFRGQNLMFEEYISKPRGAEDPLSFVYDRGQYQLTGPGPAKFTENPLDIYLEGPGFIGVRGPGGDINYTRAGNFQLGTGGSLLTAAGYKVADAGGGEITIPQESTQISIDENGVISDENGQLGQIMISEFENLQKLDPEGDNLYKTTDPALPAQNTRVKQGQLEGSNVKAVVEVNKMIKNLRSFQMVQQLLQTENQRLRTAIEQLSRV